MNDTKQIILKTTIELLQKNKNINDVSLRQIAKEADISVSVINYHFQTKENLINLAIDKYISEIIDGSTSKISTNLSLEEKIRLSIKSAAEFIVNNPNISRISILNDLNKPKADDNSSQLFSSIYNQLSEYYRSNISDLKIKLLTIQQIATVQEIFLRKNVIKKQLNLDFEDKKDREVILNALIDTILRKE